MKKQYVGVMQCRDAISGKKGDFLVEIIANEIKNFEAITPIFGNYVDFCTFRNKHFKKVGLLNDNPYKPIFEKI